nr:MAG TPA: replisome organizer [Caudoviricetes sp.]
MNNYFPHDSNSRNSDKLLPVRMKFGAEGYGIYFMILERLREEKNYMSVKDYNMLAFDLRVDAGKVKSIVEDFGLFAFANDSECFYSEGFNKRMEIKDEKSKKRSEAGKKGAAKRWQNTDNLTNLKQTYSNAIATPTNLDSKESKEKETKLKESKGKESSSKDTGGVRLSFGAFEKLWLFPNEYQRQDLESLIDEYSDKLVVASIKIAGTKDVPKGKAINFISAVLKEWALAGVKTIDQARQYQTKRTESKATNTQVNQYRKQGVRTEALPSWYGKEQPVGEEKEIQLDADIEARFEAYQARKAAQSEANDTDTA